MFSGIPNLSKSTSSNTAANSVHLDAHLQYPPVSIVQLSMVQKTYLYSGTSWGPAKWNNSFLLLLLASYLNFRTQFLEGGVLYTWSHANFHQPSVNVTKFQKGVSNLAAKVFNMLPSNIKMESDKPKKFKMALQNFLYENSFYSLDEYFSLLESKS